MVKIELESKHAELLLLIIDEYGYNVADLAVDDNWHIYHYKDNDDEDAWYNDCQVFIKQITDSLSNQLSEL